MFVDRKWPKSAGAIQRGSVGGWTQSDARFGSLRDISLAANIDANNPGEIWPINDSMNFARVENRLDESQVAITTAYFKMIR